MNRRSFRSLSLGFLTIVVAAGFSACTVDQNAALFTSSAGSKTKKTDVKTEKTKSWSERMEEYRKEREKLAASKKKEDEAKAKKLAAEKKADEAKKKALAEKKAREEAAEKKRKEEALALKKREEEKKRAAKIAARKKAEEERDARRRAEAAEEEADRGSRSSGPGLFAFLGGSTSQYKSKGHDVYVNKSALSGLNASNAKIEVDLSEQKARIYKSGGSAGRQLVIETQVSTGKSGHSTPTGTYRIQEKKVEKRSTLYGSWLNSSGSTVRSSGEAWNPPSGGSRFVGAEMPYWMRVNGGIGMHVGYVPNFPASHGCIRVPSSVQPLIFSKVGVGTQVTIKH